MADPLTVGTLAASALAMAGEAALKGVVGEAVKDAWKALKEKVGRWASSDLAALEKAPVSAGRQAVVAEAIDGRPDDEKAIVLALAEQLIKALRETRNDNFGLDVQRLEALEVQLGEITVTGGTGARFSDTKVHGKFSAGPIKVGGGSGKI